MLALRLGTAGVIVGIDKVSLACDPLNLPEICPVPNTHTVLKNYKAVGFRVSIMVKMTAEPMSLLCGEGEILGHKTLEIALLKIEKCSVILAAFIYSFLIVIFKLP